MTVSTEVDHNEYTGNGVTTTFPYAFRIFQASDLLVTTSDTNGTLRTLTLNTDYTVSGVGSYSGGVVILPLPLANGWGISIERDLPVVQETDLRNQGRFFAETHEGAFDYLTMLIQQCFGWARLALLKPSFIARYYDARQNRIANLADPAAAQDAVNNRSMRSYVDAAVSGVVGGFGWFIQYGAGAVYRTFQDKMRDEVSIRDFGAGSSGEVTDSLLKAVAATTGTIVVPAGDYTANPTLADVPAVLKLLSRADFRGRLTINLPAGTANLTEQTVINSSRSDLCKVIGVALNTSVTGLVSVAGSSKQYSITLSLADASQVSVGDYAIFRHDLTGTGFFHIHCGGWRVTAVSGNNVTVLNTCVLDSFPSSTVTGGSVSIIKSILKYTGCDGIRPEGGDCIGIIDNVAIVGDYNLATGAGTIGAHGVISTTPVVIVDPANTSNNVANMAAAIAIGRNVVISAWGEQGLAVSGRSSVVCNFIASCSNRKRGIYAEGAHIRGKFMVVSGNGEDGLIADTSGFIQAAYVVASGNGLNGFWSTNNSFIAAANSKACCNTTNGYEARGLTRLGADVGLAYGNKLNGISASYGGMIDFKVGVSHDNAFDGMSAIYGAVIDGRNCTSTTNGRYGANTTSAYINTTGSGSISGNVGIDVRDNGGGIVVRPNGVGYPFTALPQRNLTIRNEVSEAGMDMSSTTVGDTILSLKNSSAGTLNPLYIFKADGTQHPQNDATQNLGRAANRYNIGFFAGGTQSTSDATLKDPIRDFNQAELNAAMRIAKMLGFWTWLDDAGKRLHAGTTVQAVLAVLEEEGLDWRSYGFIGFDEWEDEYAPVTIEVDGTLVETGEIKLVREAGSVWQLRDQEFDRFVMRGLSERLSIIEDKSASLILGEDNI